MAALITDPQLAEDLIVQRRARGVDKYDEVWEGVYIVAPMANDEHQFLVKELTMICGIAVDWAGLGQTRPGVNVSDPREDWQTNYRIPDVAVFLDETQAENCGAFWYGGPDFAIEIISPEDRTIQKLPFFATVGTRELLTVERDPWSLTLFRLQNDGMIEVGKSTPLDSRLIESQVVPLNWQLLTRDEDLVIQVAHHDGQQHWRVRI